MRRPTIRLLLTASVLQALPLAAFLSVRSGATGPPAEPGGEPCRGAPEAQLIQALAKPGSDERRLGVAVIEANGEILTVAAATDPGANARAAGLYERKVAVSSRMVVSGSVISASGQPVAAAYLMLNRAGGPLRGTTQGWRFAEADGSFVIDAEPGKTYHLVALPPVLGELGDRERLAMGAAYARDLVAPATGLEVRMGPTDTVKGILRDADGLLLARQHVQLCGPSIGPVNWEITADHGFFEIRVPRSPGIDVVIFDGEFGCGVQTGEWRTVMNVPSSGSSTSRAARAEL